MANYSIQRPEFIGYMTTSSGYVYASGMSASAITDSNDLGSCREITFETSVETLKATSTNYNDAVVATALSGFGGTLTVVLEEMTSSAHYVIWGGSATTGEYKITGSATTPVAYTMVAEPFNIDGSPYTAVFTKCHVQPGSVRKLGKEQELLEVKFDVLVDVDASAGKEFVRFIKQ